MTGIIQICYETNATESKGQKAVAPTQTKQCPLDPKKTTQCLKGQTPRVMILEFNLSVHEQHHLYIQS